MQRIPHPQAPGIWLVNSAFGTALLSQNIIFLPLQKTKPVKLNYFLIFVGAKRISRSP